MKKVITIGLLAFSTCVVAQDWKTYQNTDFSFEAQLPSEYTETANDSDETSVRQVKCNFNDHSFFVTLTRYNSPITDPDKVSLAGQVIASTLREDDELITAGDWVVSGKTGKQAVIYSRSNAFYVDRRVVIVNDNVYSFITILGNNNVDTLTKPFFEKVSIR